MSENEAVMSMTSRKKPKMLLGGYSYVIHRSNAGNVRWQCTVRNCKGKARTEDEHGRNPNVTQDHNLHDPDFGLTKATAAVDSMKRRAELEPHTQPSIITRDGFAGVDSETNVSMPKEETIKRVLRRKRQNQLLPLPKSLHDLEVLPADYQTCDSEQWLILDNGVDAENRLLLFGKQSTLRQMARAGLWLMDGTFKSRPLLMGQLYVIHYQIGDHVIPGLFALMKTRHEASYRELFTAIKTRLPRNRQEGPQRFSMDFEIAAVNAFVEVFPSATPALCFFHFGNSLWRKAQDSGIAGEYRQDCNAELRTQFHAILALAFVPPTDVPAALEDLRTEADQRLDDVLDLVEDYYVLGRRRGRGRARPRFPPDSWNVYQRTLEGAPRTNNSCEAWNRRFEILVGRAHPNIFRFLEELRKEEQYVTTVRESIELGREPPAKKKKYVENDERLQRLAAKYGEEEGEEDENPWKCGRLKYLRNIGLAARKSF